MPKGLFGRHGTWYEVLVTLRVRTGGFCPESAPMKRAYKSLSTEEE